MLGEQISILMCAQQLALEKPNLKSSLQILPFSIKEISTCLLSSEKPYLSSLIEQMTGDKLIGTSRVGIYWERNLKLVLIYVIT